MDNKAMHADMELASIDNTEDVFNDKRLPPAEAELLKIVKAAEVDELFEHLRMHPSVNVNVVDYRGLSPLSIAVMAEQTDVVDALLAHRDIMTTDAMLHAVATGNENIMERLLDWRERAAQNGVDVDAPFESSDYPSYMTPLMLACHNNDYEMVRLLIRRGHNLPGDDMNDYAVNGKAVGETLEMGRARVDTYKALTSPVYICLTSNDPLYQAFLYAYAADKLAYSDPIFREDYQEVSENCKHFALRILEECRTSEEVRVLLAQQHDPEETGVASSGHYPRLDLALAYEMKEFICHKNCQQVLQNIWTLEHPNIMWMPMILRILYFIPHLLVLPFVYLIYIFFPCARFLEYWKAPMNKFLGDVVSYCTFLALLLYTVINANPERRTPTINQGVDVVIWVWVLSYLWDHVKLWYFYGVKAYIKDWWNIYTLAMALVFLTSIAAKGASFFIVLREGSSYENEIRNFWPWNDPILVSEAFYAFGVILAFGRLLYLFTVSQILGPLQLSLSNMITDVLQMMTIMMITMFAFAAGISHLYASYANAEQRAPGASETTTQQDFFNDFGSTFRMLFWDLFGFGGRDDPLLTVSNKCPNGTFNCPAQPLHHVLTENMGFVTYGIFHLVMITTMLNMLIAMMGNTLGRIQENSDREWKFARSRLWVAYFDRSSVLPNPFNMIPTPWDIYMLIRWLLSCRDDDARWDKNMCCYRIDSEELREQKIDEAKYKVLLITLMKRYLSEEARNTEEDEKDMVTTELLDQAKSDIIKEIYRAAADPTGITTALTSGRIGSGRYRKGPPSPVGESQYPGSKGQSNVRASAYI